MCLNGNFDSGEPCKFRLDFPESASGMAPFCSSISEWDAELFLVSNSYTTALAWLCARTITELCQVNFTEFPKTTKLCFAQDQPLTYIMSLSHFSMSAVVVYL